MTYKVLFKGFKLLGAALLVELGRGGGREGLSDLRMADGLMTSVDEVNMRGFTFGKRCFGFGGRGRKGGGG